MTYCILSVHDGKLDSDSVEDDVDMVHGPYLDVPCNLTVKSKEDFVGYPRLLVTKDERVLALTWGENTFPIETFIIEDGGEMAVSLITPEGQKVVTPSDMFDMGMNEETKAWINTQTLGLRMLTYSWFG